MEQELGGRNQRGRGRTEGSGSSGAGRSRAGEAAKSLFTEQPHHSKTKRFLSVEQEVGEDLNSQVSKETRKLKPVRARAHGRDQCLADLAPPRAPVCRNAPQLLQKSMHWDQGIFPPAESPCCHCPALGRDQITPCGDAYPPLGETDSCSTATQQDN